MASANPPKPLYFLKQKTRLIGFEPESLVGVTVRIESDGAQYRKLLSDDFALTWISAAQTSKRVHEWMRRRFAYHWIIAVASRFRWLLCEHLHPSPHAGA